jgi:hypothetical protein
VEGDAGRCTTAGHGIVMHRTTRMNDGNIIITRSAGKIPKPGAAGCSDCCALARP